MFQASSFNKMLRRSAETLGYDSRCISISFSPQRYLKYLSQVLRNKLPTESCFYMYGNSKCEWNILEINLSMIFGHYLGALILSLGIISTDSIL